MRPPASSGQVSPRRPKNSTYRCFLPDLTGFAALRRAGPSHQRYVASAVPVSLDLEREFDPAIAGCGYRAPLAPRLARPPAILPQPMNALSRQMSRRQKGDTIELEGNSWPADGHQRPILPTSGAGGLSLA